MSALHLRLRIPAGPPVDMSGITPERLCGLDADAIGALQLRRGGGLHTLADLFEFEPQQDDGEQPRLEIHEPAGRLDGIGAGMTGGRIVVHGDAGAFLGRDMAGGDIQVQGGCGAYAGTGMSGGELRIAGDAGDLLGAALPGERLGMRGGNVVVRGNAGARVGQRMRSGLILVEGRVGASCGARMIAGTIVARGGAGEGLGRGMRRGTVVLGKPPAALPSTFYDAGVQTPGFLAILFRELRLLDGAEHALTTSLPPMRRWLGDRGNDGLGEIFTPA